MAIVVVVLVVVELTVVVLVLGVVSTVVGSSLWPSPPPHATRARAELRATTASRRLRDEYVLDRSPLPGRLSCSCCSILSRRIRPPPRLDLLNRRPLLCPPVDVGGAVVPRPRQVLQHPGIGNRCPDLGSIGSPRRRRCIGLTYGTVGRGHCPYPGMAPYRRSPRPGSVLGCRHSARSILYHPPRSRASIGT